MELRKLLSRVIRSLVFRGVENKLKYKNENCTEPICAVLIHTTAKKRLLKWHMNDLFCWILQRMSGKQALPYRDAELSLHSSSPEPCEHFMGFPLHKEVDKCMNDK